MKLFQFSTLHGLREWVFHYSQYEAVELYTRETGCSLDDFEVKEINQSKWSELHMLDPNETEPDEDEQGDDYEPDDYSEGFMKAESFEEIAENLTAPLYIPMSEF